MNKHKLFEKIQNSKKNIAFTDFVVLIEAFGFRHTRSKGSHEIYRRDDIPKIINIQNDKGKAKPYQVSQFLEVVALFNLRLEDNYE